MTAGGPLAQGDQSLTQLFTELVEHNFRKHLEMNDGRVTDYVSALLLDFARIENVYKVRDAQGRMIEDVGEMLLESNPMLEAPHFDREREVRKHVGDFTLFFAGMFPESVRNWRLRRLQVGSFIDYIRAGKESYHIVAAFDQFEYRKLAPLFRKLSDSFEECVYGLNLVRRQLDRSGSSEYGRMKDLLTQ